MAYPSPDRSPRRVGHRLLRSVGRRAREGARAADVPGLEGPPHAPARRRASTMVLALVRRWGAWGRRENAESHAPFPREPPTWSPRESSRGSSICSAAGSSSTAPSFPGLHAQRVVLLGKVGAGAGAGIDQPLTGRMSIGCRRLAWF